MAPLKPAYLIVGDDDAKIDAWRTRVRTRAEAEGGPGALERFDARETTAAVVAGAAQSLTLAGGPRYLLVDDAGAWKAGDIEPLEQVLAQPAPDTVLVLIVRGKPLARLRKAVEGAGGEVREHAAPKPWKLPSWVIERAREQGLHVDSEAAKALVAGVGPRPTRLGHELEKLAVAIHPRTRLSVDDVEQMAASDAGAGVYELADALVSGDRRTTLTLAEQLLETEARAGNLLYPIVRRLRDVHRASDLLDAGVPEAKVAGALSAPPWAAKRMAAQARSASRDGLAAALCAFADLESRLRSGEGLDEATELTLTLARATA